MSSFVQFSDAANIAFHAMTELARQHPESDRINEMADRLQVSEAHLAKVMQRLRHAGLVTSIRGPRGGYQLARAADKISLLDIFETIEGPMVPKFCLFGKPICQRAHCGLGGVIGLINLEMRRFLQRTTLAGLPETITDVQFSVSTLDPASCSAVFANTTPPSQLDQVSRSTSGATVSPIVD